MLKRRRRKQIILAVLIVSLFIYKYVAYRKNTSPRRPPHHYFTCEGVDVGGHSHNISSHQVYSRTEGSDPGKTCKNRAWSYTRLYSFFSFVLLIYVEEF